MATKKSFEVNLESGHEIRLKSLEEAMNRVFEKQQFFDHHVEHEVVGIKDHINNVLSKLEKREDSAESRLDSVEDVSYN